jgi:hypothetical protein
MHDDVGSLPTTRLLQLYRSKDLSPVEAVGETLRRLERLRRCAQRLCPLRPRVRLEARYRFAARGHPQPVGPQTYTQRCQRKRADAG